MAKITLGSEQQGGTREVLAGGRFIGSAQLVDGRWLYRRGHGAGIIVQGHVEADTEQQLLERVGQDQARR